MNRMPSDAELERALTGLRGVRAARLGRGAEGVEVDLVVEESVAETPLVARVRTLLRAEAGIDVPGERIRTAPVLAGGPARTRWIFRSVHLYREGHRAEAQVELGSGGKIRVGRAEGAAVRGGLLRLVALAALDAVGTAFGSEVALHLAAVQRQRIGGRALIVTHLILVTGRDERHLSGSVLVTSDPFEATVFAVLDALNRVLPEAAPVDEIEYEVEDILSFVREEETR